MIRCCLILGMLLGFLYATVSDRPCFADEKISSQANAKKSPPPFEWNVFLSGWELLGPLPDGNNGNADKAYVDNESALNPETKFIYDEKTYDWQHWPGSLVDFDEAFGILPGSVNYKTAYAWTSFESPAEQNVILSLSHDDSAIVWLNGKQVIEVINGRGPCKLDQFEQKVTLKKGTNTLLVKIGQLWGEWEFGVRMLPLYQPGEKLRLKSDQAYGLAMTRMPIFALQALDQDKQEIASFNTSGHRVKTDDPRNGKACHYAFVPPSLSRKPAFIRVSYNSPGLKNYDQTFSWEELVKENITVPLEAELACAVKVVDAETGEPIPHAEILRRGISKTVPVDENGSAVLEDESPLQRQFWVGAKGYLGQNVLHDWPRTELRTVKLKKGGKTIRGQIVSLKDKKPIPNVRINLNLNPKENYCPPWLTDEEGRFEVFGQREDLKNLNLTVHRSGFIPLERLAFTFAEGAVTEVNWELDPGAIVKGQVVSKKDGKPVAGALIQEGVYKRPTSPATRSNASGRFWIQGFPPGNTTLNATSNDFAMAVKTVQTNSEEPVEVLIELEEGQDVTGRVLDADGKPVSGAHVQTVDTGGGDFFRKNTTTNTQGEFTLTQMPSTFLNLHVYKPGYLSLTKDNVKGGAQVEIQLEKSWHLDLEIRLEGEDSPPKQLTIHKGYSFPRDPNPTIHWSNHEYDTTRLYNQATGVFRYEAQHQQAAKVCYRFRASGYQDVIVDMVRDPSGASSQKIVLKKAPRKTGRVVSAETGEPLSGVMLFLLDPKDIPRIQYHADYQHPYTSLKNYAGFKARTKTDGSFELPQPDDVENYDLFLTRQDEGFIYLQGYAKFAEADELRITYPAAGTIEGHVVTAGKPQADEKISFRWIPYLYSENPMIVRSLEISGSVKTDENGHYRIPGLGPGKYQISRQKSLPASVGSATHFIDARTVILQAGQTVEENIERPAGHRLTGALQFEEKPIVEANVALTALPDPGKSVSAGTLIDVTRPDSNGKFTFENIAPGHYEVAATVPRKPNSGSMFSNVEYQGIASVQIPDQNDVTIELKKPALQQRIHSGAEPSVKGTEAPELSGTPLGSDTPFALSDQWGKIVVIDFWATWCGPCMAVMPQLKAAYEKYGSRDDVVFITVSLDQSKEALEKVIKAQELKFPVLFDGDAWQTGNAKAYGIQSIPAMFVIGRDGKFATERIRATELDEALSSLLSEPVDPIYASAKRPSALGLQLTVSEQPAHVPGAKFLVKVNDAAGKTVHEQTLSVANRASQAFLRYPALESGEIVVEAQVPGLPSQTKTLKNPSAHETLAFDFVPPRKVTGKLVVKNSDLVPSEMTITIGDREAGLTHSAQSDQSGAFEISCFPGNYTVTVAQTDKLTMYYKPSPKPGQLIEEGQLLQVKVGTEQDPASIEIPLVKVITIAGTVVDSEGKRVSKAQVIMQTPTSSSQTKTDDEGKFVLTGVPETGAALIHIAKPGKRSLNTLSEEGRDQPLKLVLDDQSNTTPIPSLAELIVQDLSGASQKLPLEAEQRHLLIVAQLSTPQARKFVPRALKWCEIAGIKPILVSTDWSIEETKRLLKELNLGEQACYGGPGGAGISDNLSINFQLTLQLLDSKGTMLNGLNPEYLPQ